METTAKARTPSRCREWERQRRNKFNEAITKLGETVRAINKANDASEKDNDNTLPKVEIVLKAIACLTNCAQEKTQLKAEILALQVKIEAKNFYKEPKKDASTQVYTSYNKKNQKLKLESCDPSSQAIGTAEEQPAGPTPAPGPPGGYRRLAPSSKAAAAAVVADPPPVNEVTNLFGRSSYNYDRTSLDGKHVKLLMLQKSKRNALKEKPVLTTNVTIESKTKKNIPTVNNSTLPILSKLLPKTENVNEKKRTENTIVVLPAAPYIFPQRPLFLPAAVPPAFVIVDPNMQSLNKTSTPSIVNRTSGDTTRTTMVNILPISAYSRPLSATKVKKTSIKPKVNISKRLKKKLNPPKKIKELVSNNEIKNNNNKQLKPNTDTIVTSVSTDDVKDATILKCNKPQTPKITHTNKDNSNNMIHKKKENDCGAIQKNEENVDKEIETPNHTTAKPAAEDVNLNQNLKTVSQLVQTNQNVIQKQVNVCLKTTLAEEKDKENKLPTILESTLCENGVDVGNARLELAEEFLAASPTAAFLMSFPLVSGNRADSPAEETSSTVHANVKENASLQLAIQPPTSEAYFEKHSNSDGKTRSLQKQIPTPPIIPNKQPTTHKYVEVNISKPSEIKPPSSIAVSGTNVSSDNPFLSLPMPSLALTTSQSDTFGLDFDCNISKSIPNQTSTYVSNSNIFYKSDPFNTVKSSIYSTSSIASGHEFNSLGLYPCAMEKYSKNKSDFTNVEDNLMKIGSSRLTYDIDLGWSHKGFDFVNCTTNSNSFSKDILTTATAPSYSGYNPFNPEFHVPLVSSSNKKDTSSKPISSFAETITSFYSTPQPSNLWSEDMCLYNNVQPNNVSKTLSNKHQSYLNIDHVPTNSIIKSVLPKQFESKTDSVVDNIVKQPNDTIRHQIPDKYNKKSPSKMHINWMTSELRPMQNNCNPPQTGMKETQKQQYSQMEHATKKQEHNDGNYFPITMHNFPTQPTQDDFQVWPSTRPLGTTEISIEPPPINLPTLVGDLALGPHDKKKSDLSNRSGVQSDIQNCGNFLSVTQLMNRSSDNVTSRYHGSNVENSKSAPAKQSTQFANDSNRKTLASRIESNITQPCYVFNDLKPINSYETMGQFSQLKPKTNKNDKAPKIHKHSYSAEALIRSGTGSQKAQDYIGHKFITPSQKYSDFNTAQDTSVAQVSHFPPMLDYSDNNYTGQQFSGTTLYNSTTNTISNSFYSNFMSGSANIMSGSYTTAPFTGDFMDYNQAECNYPNNKYEEFKMRSNPSVFQDKVPTNYKSSRRESGAKHKLECSKKDSNKKCQSKRSKLSSEVEEWNDGSNLFWQNKGPNKKHPNLMSEEFPFTNYVGNQMGPQYQHELFNSHLVGVQAPERALAAFPATSRANFNLSTIFPEITMKVQ